MSSHHKSGQGSGERLSGKRLSRSTHRNPAMIVKPIVVFERDNKSGRKYLRYNLKALSGLRSAMRAALNPAAVYSPVKTLADMTAEERAVLELRYNAKISAPESVHHENGR